MNDIIECEIDECTSFVILISNKFLDSYYYMKEYNFADAKKKPKTVFLLDGMGHGDLSSAFNSLEYFRPFNDEGQLYRF